MKRLFLAFVLLAPLSAFGAAGINFTNTVPNLLVRTNATIRSGLPDNPANVAMIVDTVGSWSDDLPLISLNNHGTNVATIYAGGGYNAGRGQSAIYGPYPQGLFITTTTDLDGITANYFSFEHTDSTDENSFGIIRGNMETNSAEFSIETRDVYRIISDWTMSGVTPSCDWSVKVNGTEVTHFDPLAIVGSSAYTLNTIDPTASGPPDYLLRVQLTNSDRLTVDSAGNVSAAGQMGFTGFTTANLPAGVAVGYQTYCTDCLTPWGAGDRVEWDGTVWRTLRVKVLATTNVATYMLSCATNRIVQFTSKSDIAFQPIFATAVSGNAFVPAVFGSGGTGGAAGNGGVNAVGNFIALTGGSAAAYGRVNGALFNVLQTGDAYYCGEDVAVSAIPDGTDNYMDWKGLVSTTTTNYPVEGAYFLYDRYNASGVVSNATFTATWTNNWICVTAHSASYSFVDSGLAASTLTTAPNRLDVIATPTEATFYTNGVICATINTQLPTTALWANSVEHLKTLGSTARTLNFFNRRFHVRRGTAYSF